MMGKYDFDLDIYDNNTIAWIADRVNQGTRVLEFGPANGRLTKYLSKVKKCYVDIVEIDEESGAEAAAFAEKALVGPEYGDIEKYFWLETSEKFDFIIFADVLEHLVHPENVLKACKKVIAEKGKILVSIPNISHNSVIIELLNDRFEYNPTGILDNTHLRFFTRQSFEKMVLGIGWAIVEEKAKNIRVGENEIKNSYNDVPKEIFRELVHRPQGNIYQYMFSLSLSEDYLLGKQERIVSLDSSSYYFSEILYDQDGVFDYKKSVSRHYDPYYGRIDIEFSILVNSKKAIIKPLNCNCILNNIVIKEKQKESTHLIEHFQTNGIQFGSVYYFLDKIGEITVDLSEKASELMVQADVLKYDFDDGILNDVVIKLDEVCKNHEDEIIRTHREHQEEIEKLEKEHQEEIGKLDREYRDDIEKLNKKHQDDIEKLNREHQEEISKIDKDHQDEKHELEKDHREFVGKVLDYVKKRTQSSGLDFITLKNKLRHKKIKFGPTDSIEYKGNCAQKKITAVIPNYNYARFLNERIDSVLFQTYPVSELIILDDCSTDNSVEIINERIKNNTTGIPMRLVVNEKNSGSVFSQWQKAFMLAKGDYVWIAEADDSCDKRFLETVMKGFDDEEVVISYCESLTIDENNVLLMGDLRVWIDIFNTGKWNENYVKDGKEEVAETMCINNTIANVSSAVIKNGDYFDILEGAKEYKLAGDWYTYMNILKQGKIAYFKESLNYHRMQTQGLTLSTSHEREFDEIVRLQNFALENFNVTDEVKKKVYERRERERKRFGL